MRDKKACITKAKQSKAESRDDLVTIVVFEKPCNSKLKTINFPFIKVNGRSLLEKQIEAIECNFKNYEIIFCCGNTSQKTYDYFKKANIKKIRIVENQIFNNSNCCESIRLALNNTFNDKILIVSEDIMLSSSSIASIEMNSTCVLTSCENLYNNFEIGAICENSRLDSLTIGIKQNYWTETLFLGNPRALKEFKNILSLEEFKNKLFFESVNMLSKKQDIKIIKTSECAKLNNLKTLKKVSFE